ncbi:hypothetical protein HZA87_00285 [Candidatus Uhrbacteria bacterium]|nr:hypothetical protein [Candidatus Uhrbacteria bacterium]
MDPFPWKRVQKALTQYARHHNLPKNRTQEVIDLLPKLVELSGNYTCNRSMVIRIGETLLAHRKPRFLVPSCPAYAYRSGRYTFQGVGMGVPLLTMLHVKFLRKVLEILPSLKVTILVANQEAEDLAICAKAGIDQEEFRRRILTSLERTQRLVRPLGWDAAAMTEFIPNFLGQEKQTMEWIAGHAAFRGHVLADTLARVALYRRIGEFTDEEKVRRTIRTAAQYVVLGRFAESQDFLICNHTTTSLAWYLKTRVGLLHNPVTVY